jgi:hypothetical protein
VVNVGAPTVKYADWPPVRAQITERYILFRNYNGGASNGELIRIDRVTGQMTFKYQGQSHWDTTFGEPGVICERSGAPGPGERDILRD